MDMMEEGCGSGDGRGNKNMPSVVKLAFMAGLYEPSNISVQSRPLKSTGKMFSSRERLLVAELVMSLRDKRNSLFKRNTTS